MHIIHAVLFEPVGCLAEFPAGSQAYWQSTPNNEELELQEVDQAIVYEDAAPALKELQAMGTNLIIATSLSAAAVGRFLERSKLAQFFTEVWNRDNAGGIKAAPLNRAIASAGLQAENVMFLTDTAEGLNVAKSVGVNAILMMNDPDEAMHLAAYDPSGGIVSLHELPDFLRLVQAENLRQLRR